MAITDGNLSQYLAATAAVVAAVSPLHGGVLAVGAAAMGVCGNYRQAVANDPPRDDFGEVQVTQAKLDDSFLPTEEPSRTLHLFAAHQLMLSNAFSCFLRSLERHDGAVDAGNVDAANTQVDAARQNAEIAVGIQDFLTSLIPAVNEAAASLQGDSAQSFGDLTLEQVQQVYREVWGEPPPDPGDALKEVARSVLGTVDDLLEPFDPVAAHPILSATDLPPERQVVIEDSYPEGLARVSSALRDLVVGG